MMNGSFGSTRDSQALISLKSHRQAVSGCGFNRSMQHLFSKYREEDVENETASNSSRSLNLLRQIYKWQPKRLPKSCYELVLGLD